MNTVAIILSFIFSGIAGYKVGKLMGMHLIMKTIVEVGRKQFKDFDKKMSQGLVNDLNASRVARGKSPLTIKEIKK